MKFSFIFYFIFLVKFQKTNLQFAGAVAFLNKEKEELQAQLTPLKQQITLLETKVEAIQRECELTAQDRDNWKERSNAILTKYDVNL